jgi:hypothetical protein
MERTLCKALVAQVAGERIDNERLADLGAIGVRVAFLRASQLEVSAMPTCISQLMQDRQRRRKVA